MTYDDARRAMLARLDALDRRDDLDHLARHHLDEARSCLAEVAAEPSLGGAIRLADAMLDALAEQAGNHDATDAVLALATAYRASCDLVEASS